MKKLWLFISGTVILIMGYVNTVIDFSKNVQKMTSLATIQSIAQIILPIVFLIFIWRLFNYESKIEKRNLEQDKRNADQDKYDATIFHSINILREQVVTLKIFNQCLIEETTKYFKNNFNSEILTSEKQIEAIKEKAKNKMNKVFRDTKTDAEKEALMNMVITIPIEQKM